MTIGAASAAAPAPVNGPEADYPKVVGAPYTIGASTFTPVDTMNYDAVGYASVTAGGGSGITGAHHTLPIPSYVEVTSLDSGKTILVRLEQRGPMDGPDLIALSPGAAAQLGLPASGKAAVRVRRVNPPESERALLRSGQEAPPRMSTPKPLLAVLARKLTPDAAVQLAREGDAHMPTQAGAAMTPMAPKPLPAVKHGRAIPHIAPPAPALAASTDQPAPAPEPMPMPMPMVSPGAPQPHVEHASAKPPKAAPILGAAPGKADGFVVQAGAYAVKANADAAAHKIDAAVAPVGKLWRVRLGPFASRPLAEAALAKAQAAGYSGARIQRAD